MPETLHYHTEDHEGTQRYCCDFCDHWAMDRDLFAQHMQQRHDVALSPEDTPEAPHRAARPAAPPVARAVRAPQTGAPPTKVSEPANPPAQAEATPEKGASA